MLAQLAALSRIYLLHIRTWLLWFALQTILFPMGLVFFIRATGSPLSNERFLAGAIVMTLSSTTINSIGFWLMSDRLEKHFELICAMPVRRSLYYLAIVLVSNLQALINVHILFILFRVLFGIHYTWLNFVVVVFAAMLLSLIGVAIGIKARNTNEGALLINLFGTGMTLICPIFYPAAALPGWVAGIASLIPHTLIFRMVLFSMGG